MVNDILKIVKTLQGIKNDEQDELVLLYIEMAVQSVLNYCSRSDLPKELKFVVANMVNDMYAETQGGGADLPVSSVSEGRRSVSFDSTALQAKINDRIKNLRQLNGFKLIYKL